MDNFSTKIFLLVTCIVVAVADLTTNKLESSNTGLTDLQRRVWYLRKDMFEIRDLILTIPYFKDIMGDDEEKYYEKTSRWYDSNRNTFNKRRRDLESIEEKVKLSSTFSASTTKNLQELNESDKQQFILSMGSRWKDLTDRLRALEESVMAIRVAADKASRALHAESGSHSLRDHDLLEAKAILEDEQHAATNRTRTIGALQGRFQQVENRFSNIKMTAEDILSKRAELQKNISSVKERSSTTETEIKEVEKKLALLQKGGIPAGSPSTPVGGGLNYIISVKKDSGKGKRIIKLKVLSD